MHETRKPFRGYLYIATATFFWGVSATLGRAAFTGRLPGLHAVNAIDPLILSQCRATFSFLVLLPVLRLLRGRPGLSVSTRDVGQLFLIGILGVAASNYFYYLAIQRANVATAITVQYTAPIWVLVYTVARGLQKFTLQRVAAVGLAVTGIALVIGVIGKGELRLDPLAYSPPCSRPFPSPFTTSLDITSLPAATAGSCCCTPPAARLFSGFWSILHGN